MSDEISNINQTDYMKLFMQELTYQDPLKPVDNREFMAQMAQFSALQQATATNQSVGQLLGMINGNQGLMLLGKMVRFRDSNEMVKIEGVEFPKDDPPRLRVRLNGVNQFKQIGEIAEVQ